MPVCNICCLRPVYKAKHKMQEEEIMKVFSAKKAMAALLASMMLMTGCAGSKTSGKPLKNDPMLKTEIDLNQVAYQKYDAKKLNTEYVKYSFKMLAEIAANAEKNCNIMISPASIMMALDMVAAGAKGETLKQMNELFAKDTDPLEQQAFASELMKRINAANKVKFVCANAIWSDEDKLAGKINTDYRDYIKKTFGADFNATSIGPNTHNEINKWVDDKTNHMIPKLFDQPFDSDVIMVLVNAIRFEAQWRNGYSDAQVNKGKFRGTDGDKEAQMLYSSEKGYFATEKATGFIKYYEGEQYAFIAILPSDEKADANSFIKSFSYEDYRKFIQSRTSEDVNAVMPEFKSDYGSELNGILKKLGVTDAFIETKADLSGIAKSPKGNLYISKVIHKTHIEVDRKGTKAAAATGVSVAVESAVEVREPKAVVCDRPYVYVIVDASTMNPIFIGTVNNAG